MKTKFTKSDIHEGRLEVAPGLFARVTIEQDNEHGAPWEENDGHGEVSGWERRDKRPHERILHTDRSAKRFYDMRASMKQAEAEGWGIREEARAKLAAKLGREPAPGDILAAAVNLDFEYLRGWCADEWRYVFVSVTLENEEGKELASDHMGGIEDLNGNDREQAAEMLNTLIERHDEEAAAAEAARIKEEAEAAHWAARDSMTTT